MSQKEYDCPGCNKKIKSGSVSKALDQRWHADCFKCEECKLKITGSFLTKSGKPYCKPCYNQTFGLKCYVCDLFITGHILKYNGQAYHYPCVSCKQCGKEFSDGAALSVKGGKFIHNDCKKLNKHGMTKGDLDAVKEKKDKLEQEGSFDGSLAEFENACLTEHNKKRADHGVSPLEWSEECEKHAKMWVQHLVELDSLAHDHESGLGENCGYFNSSSATTKPDILWAENVSNMWYNEISKYNFDKNDYQPQTGHFTQMVWKGSEKMGCAIAKKGTKVFIVANYFPPGNFMGKYADNVFKAGQI